MKFRCPECDSTVSVTVMDHELYGKSVEKLVGRDCPTTGEEACSLTDDQLIECLDAQFENDNPSNEKDTRERDYFRSVAGPWMKP